MLKKRKSIAAIKGNICGTCSKVINDKKESSIQCDECQKWCHIPCSGLKESEVQPTLDDSTIPFKCSLCSNKVNDSELPSSQFNLIMCRLDEMVTSFKSLTESHATLRTICNELQKEFTTMTSVNKELKETVDYLTIRVRTLENVRLRSQLFFKTKTSGLNDKDPASTVVDICSAVGLKIQKSDIRSAVVQRKMSGNDSSVVKIDFKDEDSKINIMKNRAKIRTKFNDAAFFDVLSKDNAVLYKSARMLCSKGFAFVYHRNGRIYAKKTTDAIPILVKSTAMVEQLSIGTASDFSTPQMVMDAAATRRSLNFNADKP